MSTLLLRLAAPLQSWGIASLYDKRETESFPSKSGVIGMIASAMGRRRGESLDDLEELEFGVRIDSPGIRMHDFQVTAMGGKLNSNISDRVYLSDAVFLVGLSSRNLSLLEKISYSINNPVFPLFLGRRSCPATVPLNLGIQDSGLIDALKNEEWLVPEWRRNQILRYQRDVHLRIIVDAENDHGAVRKDVPVSFSPFRREYKYRYIKEIPAKVIQKKSEDVPLEHDPMKDLG